MKRFTIFIMILMLAAASFTAYAEEAASLVKARAAILAEAAKDVKQITVADLEAIMQSGKDYTLVDIREANEQGFIIPGNNKMIPRGLLEWVAGKQLSLDDNLVVYCKTGARGTLATKRLQELGFKNAVNLKGGIVAWLEAGKPVSTYIGEITPTGYKFNK